MEAQEIVERGWFAALVAPDAPAAARQERLLQVERALAAFAPVFRPLALQIERCWRDLDIGLPSRSADPDPYCCILASTAAAMRAVVRPTIGAAPPPRVVSELDHDSIAACLRETAAPAPAPNLLLDWRSIRTIAAAVRSFDALEEFVLRPAGMVVRAFEPGWFAGPLGATGFEVVPPAELVFQAEDRVTLTVNVYWSRWRFVGTPERAAFERAIAELEGAGWRRELV